MKKNGYSIVRDPLGVRVRHGHIERVGHIARFRGGALLLFHQDGRPPEVFQTPDEFKATR